MLPKHFKLKKATKFQNPLSSPEIVSDQSKLTELYQITPETLPEHRRHIMTYSTT